MSHLIQKSLVHYIALVFGVLLICGCTSHAPRVECDGRLVPINAPAKPSTPSDGKETKDKTRSTAPEPRT